ncbi:uncharacterized protein MYCFIDRAFT_194082 [Pseudocercospora fijiensis CIRAD86]|uniref:Uncharacterized protein n=1 Tax=Pseudocercospora fijiensis (strain CIRAD86) TaxID=383855 RepID=M3AMR6_PSEFD|nr:uncharacterized protein MYCFIDRAFT_194082 [Pseudocercospora fijiensis CIRAD86]EME85876.1 hypothetical protein MYCFIDRAFT_194082 [Pseudocercospora fijiensis CIRAD86]
MSTENPNYNVGGTAKDGGLSTADTVADGDIDGGNRPSDGAYQPDVEDRAAPKETRSKTAQNVADDSKQEKTGGEAHVGNENYGVGGVRMEGSLTSRLISSDTVADGGPDAPEEDEDFKP